MKYIMYICPEIKNSTMRKNIDLSEKAVKTLTIRAVKEGTVFKHLAEDILEKAANPNYVVPKKRK